MSALKIYLGVNESYVLGMVLSCIKHLKECTDVFLTRDIPRCLSLQCLMQTIMTAV